MTRREVREVTFMMLFQLEFGSDISIDDTLAQYYTIDADSTDEDESTVTVELARSDRKYIESIVNGVKEKTAELDAVIEKYSKGWSIERIIKVDLAILRYGIYEMTYMEKQTPIAVSINEAVELSKKYGTDKSKAFVNGVLSSYCKALKGEK